MLLNFGSKKTSSKDIIKSNERLNKDVMDANDRASWLEAAMSLALTTKQNEQELKVLIIVFAMFALYIIF